MNYLITHTDLDGYGCELLIKLIYNDSTIVKRVNYDKINEVVEKTLKILTSPQDRLIITDIFPDSEKTHQKLIHFQGELHIYDHHGTSIPSIKKIILSRNGSIYSPSINSIKPIHQSSNPRNFSVVKDDISATKLVSWFHGIKLPSVDYINEYDTSGTTEGVAGGLNYLFYNLSKKQIRNILLRDPLVLKQNEKKIISKIIKESNEYFKKQLKTLQTKNISGYKVAIIEANDKKSFILNKLLSENDYVTLIDNSKNLVSFRGIYSGCDEAASKLGGGGHPQAAGAQGPFTFEELFKIWNEVLSK